MAKREAPVLEDRGARRGSADSNGPTIDEIVVADEPEAWTEAGFLVEGDLVRVGSVRIRLVGRERGKRILEWAIRDLASTAVEGSGGRESTIDGLPTRLSSATPCAPSSHPNGVVILDHIVLLTPDHRRSVDALERAGFAARRTREATTGHPPTLQTFFRAGEVIIELVSAGSGDGPAHFFGLAFTVEDLERAKSILGDGLGSIRDAVQPGRRIATLGKDTYGISVDIAMMSA